MPDKKPWKRQAEELFTKHQKKLLYGGIALLAAVLLFAAFGLTLKLNFLLGDEIILHLTPQETSLQMHYGDTKEVKFSFYASNFPTCTASCSYAFTDKSQNRILDNRSFMLGQGELLEKTYSISISRIGRGQDVYSFDVSCRNEPSFLCLSSGIVYRASSPVVVNYDLSEEEKLAKEQARINLTSLLQSLKDMDASIKQLDLRVQALSPSVPLIDVLDEKAALEEQFSKLLIETERLRSLWNKESYLELLLALNGSQEETAQSIKNALFEENALIDTHVQKHNELTGRILLVSGQFERDTEWSQESTTSSELGQKANNARNAINSTVPLFTGKYANYSMLEDSVQETELAIIEFGEMLKASLLKKFAQANFHTAKEIDYLCMLKGASCNTSGSMGQLFSDYQSWQAKEWWQQESSMQHCTNLENLEKTFNETKNSTRALLGSPFPTDDDFNASALALQQFIRENIMQQYRSDLKAINDTQFLNSTLPLTAPKNAPLVQDNLTLRQYFLTTLELSQESAQYKMQTCGISYAPPMSIFAAPLGFSMLVQPIIELPYEANSTIDAVLSDNPPVCCVLGECKECCTSPECAKDPATYPIIFLHGHAFTTGSSAAYSLDAFTSIQSALEQEGYLKAGIVTPQTTESGTPGEWGLSGKPVTVKASYYFDAFREEEDYVIVPTKSENIDTYALRLRDIVSTVKEKTGKDQVVIVAHSMGGLVARRYVQVFGDNDVYKLVMIGTPNRGVVGRAKDYCPVFGEQKECLDMQENSLFLNKLNDPSKQPQKAALYVIAGTGCKMDGKNGDGVVLYDHAVMQNAQNYNVTGTCGGLFGEVLHTEMLDVEKYLYTFQLLKEILKET